MTEPAPAPRLKMWEFMTSGYFAATDLKSAIAAVMKHIGSDEEEAEDEFLREVPDDEVITAVSEDSWGDPRETQLSKFQYALRLPASEHVLLAAEWGYCFGGEE